MPVINRTGQRTRRKETIFPSIGWMMLLADRSNRIISFLSIQNPLSF
jgi:hypothetical protein